MLYFCITDQCIAVKIAIANENKENEGEKVTIQQEM
jgi:hypothetical protein